MIKKNSRPKSNLHGLPYPEPWNIFLSGNDSMENLLEYVGNNFENYDTQ